MNDRLKYLTMLPTLSTYRHKLQFATLFLTALEKTKGTVRPQELAPVTEAVYLQLKELREAFSTAAPHRVRDEMTSYAEALLGILLSCYGDLDRIPPQVRKEIDGLYPSLCKVRSLALGVEELLVEGKGTADNLAVLIARTEGLTDEYHRGSLYRSLIEHREYLKTLSRASRQVLAEHIVAQMQRYLASVTDDDCSENLAMLCDLCGELFVEDMVAPLTQALSHTERPCIAFHATLTMLDLGREVPQQTIRALCYERSMTAVMYNLLAERGMLDRFPEELATVEQLVISRMVHWLLYPTELGQEPDAIEYLGQVTKKKQTYHILRFLSHSSTLDEGCQGQWLVGWVAEDGGAFSHFSPYARFERKTPRRTLACIARRGHL